MLFCFAYFTVVFNFARGDAAVINLDSAQISDTQLTNQLWELVDSSL